MTDGRTTPTHGTLTKRASELRDILGLAKCSNLLSRVLEKQYADSTIDHPTNLPEGERIPFTLRAEANEWTPPTGTESPRNILKKVLHLGLNGDTTLCDVGTKSLLQPFIEKTPSVFPIPQVGTFYLPPAVVKSETPADLTGNGKQFISSLSAKREVSPAPAPQKPIAPPSKRAKPPPGLTPAPSQHLHSFPLNASLLPQTFSVHLLSTLHMRFQHVSAALEMIDSSFASEMSKTWSVHPPASTRWESWMSPSGTAEMARSLIELRKSLDELCGATARAGWIVDTWGAYQDGMLDGPKQSDPGFGSAAINGVEIGGTEVDMHKDVQAPIGRPATEKKEASQVDKTKNAEQVKQEFMIANGRVTKRVVPALPVTLRPPPGLPFPASPLGNSSHLLPRESVMMNESRPFPPTAEAMNGSTDEFGKTPDKDRIALMRSVQQVNTG